MSLPTIPEPAHAAMLIHRATQFIATYQAQHLDNDPLVKRCCAHLMSTTGITESAAAHYTMHALADVQARHVPAYFDTNHSTSFVVRVADPSTGHIYSLTASDVLQLAKAQNDAPADTTHSVHVCGRRVV